MCWACDHHVIIIVHIIIYHLPDPDGSIMSREHDNALYTHQGKSFRAYIQGFAAEKAGTLFWDREGKVCYIWKEQNNTEHRGRDTNNQPTIMGSNSPPNLEIVGFSGAE